MPGVIRKLLIFAAVDGLILQPYGNGSRLNGGGHSHNESSSSIRIDYKTSKITSLPTSALSGQNEKSQDVAEIEAYGLVGMHAVLA